MTDHRKLWRPILMAVCLLAVAVGPSSCGGGAQPPAGTDDITNLNEFYAVYGRSNPDFVSHETSDVIAFFRQRMVGEAVVQGDHMLYQFEKGSGRKRKERIRWDAPVPQALPEGLMTRSEAEALVGGVVESSQLYYIEPNSHVMPLTPVPDNPCWVCCSGACGEAGCTIVDAVLGVILGMTVPSPDHTAFSGTGPYGEDPCHGGWTSWRNNAADWFDTMGYDTETFHWPTENEVRGHIQSNSTAMFYEIGHSQHTEGILFTSGCTGTFYEETTAVEVSAWITHYPKMPFTFLASCYAMSSTAMDTLSFAFRKGSLYNTAVVGFKEMGTYACEGPCWNTGYSFDWQDALFDYMNQGDTVKAAFDQANLDYPSCVPCTGFVGDEYFAVVPVVIRGLLLAHIDIVLMRIPEILDLPLPPDPLIRQHLEDAKTEAEAARDALERGDPRTALERSEQAVDELEQAEAGGVEEAGEPADELVKGADEHVTEGILDAESVVDPENQDLQEATRLLGEAQAQAQAGERLNAMGLFLEAWDALQKALGGGMPAGN